MKKQAEKTSRKNRYKNNLSKTIENKSRIIEYVGEKRRVCSSEISDYIELSPPRTRALILELVKEGKLLSKGSGRSTYYVLPDGIE